MQGRVVPQFSQEYKVREALNQAGVSHNSGIVAQIDNVLVRPDGIVYFCYSKVTQDAEFVAGDGGAVPERVVLAGNWDFPEAGYYNLRNTRIVVNGAITLTREDESEVTMARTLYGEVVNR
jgi:hypothetical protein